MIRVLILLLGCAAGLAIIGYSLKPISDAREAQAWPTADATITRSDVAEVVTSKKKPGEKRRESVVRYQADVTYDYIVSGVNYTGSRVAYVYRVYPNTADVDPVLANYPEGKVVRVHYDPAEPANAVIEPRAEALHVFTYFGALISLASVWCIFKGAFRRERGVVA